MLPTWRILSPQLNNLPCYYGRRRCRLYDLGIAIILLFPLLPPSFLPSSLTSSILIYFGSPFPACSLTEICSLSLPIPLSLPFLPRPLCAAAGPRRATRKGLRRRQWGKGESVSPLTIGCVRVRRWGS